MQERPLRRGESLAGIAQALYGDAALGAVLQRLNGIDDPRRLEPGLLLRVPRLDFERVATSPPATPAPELALEPARKALPAPDPAEARALRQARSLYEAGEYRAALAALAALDGDDTVDGGAADARRRLAAFARIALDENDEACRVWAGDDPPAAAAARAAALDPVRVSPKIRDVLSGCARPATEG